MTEVLVGLVAVGAILAWSYGLGWSLDHIHPYFKVEGPAQTLASGFWFTVFACVALTMLGLLGAIVMRGVGIR